MASPQVALKSLQKRISVDWKNRTEQEARAHLVRVAKAGHAAILKQQVSREYVFPEFSYYANTPGNTNLESVRLPGPIVFIYRYFTEIFLVAVRELINNSPRRSGLYAKNHKLFINDREAPSNSKIKFGDVIFIANPVIYARRLEIGKTESGRNFLISVPNRIYERVARQLRARYGKVAKITFGYVTLPLAYITQGKLSATYKLPSGHHRKRNQRAGTQIRSPAIFIEAFT